MADTATQDKPATKPRISGGKGTARSSQKPAKGKGTEQPDTDAATALQKYEEHKADREKDSTIALDTGLLVEAKRLNPDMAVGDEEKAALAQAKMQASPASKAKGKAKARATGEAPGHAAFKNAKGETVTGHKAAYHAVDGDPEGTLKFLGLFKADHTGGPGGAVEQARKANKDLPKDAVIVTLNSRYVLRSAPPELVTAGE